MAPRPSRTGNRGRWSRLRIQRRLGSRICQRCHREARARRSSSFARWQCICAACGYGLGQWRVLAERAVEPNGYNLPDWELRGTPSRAAARGVRAWRMERCFAGARWRGGLIGLLPVISFWRAYKIPLPVTGQRRPLRHAGHAAARFAICTNEGRRPIAAAGAKTRAGAHCALVLARCIAGWRSPMHAIHGRCRGKAACVRVVLQSHLRACLECHRGMPMRCCCTTRLGTQEAEGTAAAQRHRLAGHGAVRFDVARTPEQLHRGREFLALEASGWKARRGHRDGAGRRRCARFIRRAATALAERGQCEIVTLRAGRGAGPQQRSCSGIWTGRSISSWCSTSASAKFSARVQSERSS